MKILRVQLDSCGVTKDVYLEAPHYNDSLIASSLQSVIREVVLCALTTKYSQE